jgi:GrpB-like predicted nucleotidyltransferase (UPF0157 family)/N-acetylglutamate synthase-like GNAT family acetyltransferase
MSGSVILSPYNEDWTRLFKEEAVRIKEALGENCITIHHIGSTAIPGIDAKPIIDMLPVVKGILSVEASALDALGYEGRGELGMPFRRYFSNKTHHIHLWEDGADEIQKQLLFRDYLRSHTLEREAYGDLKRNLAKKFHNNRALYTESKSSFIQETLKKAEFSGFEFVNVLLQKDWDAYHRIRQEQIFSHHPDVTYDPHHETLTQPSHFHFVLKKLENIVGVCHVEFLDEDRAALRPFAIDELYQKRGCGTYLLSLVEKWIQYQGRSFIHVHANPRALSFYKKSGYTPYFFDEKKEKMSEGCIDLRKILS